ncbi:MAG: hypothetical protein IPM74_13530 [Crocinitomicaceae bacterium]|nr:hypothetical protein [Crocinitomicaceae bacterium]
MLQKSKQIPGIFRQKQDDHIRIFQEISDVISVFAGPKIDSTIDYKNLHKKTIGSASVFSFTLSSDSSLIEYKLFKSGELVLHITINLQDQFQIKWLDEKSETLAAFIDMQFKPLLEKQEDQAATPIVTISNSAEAIAANPNNPFEYAISFESEHQFEERFIAAMNKACKLITENRSPEFGYQDRKTENRIHTHEDFTRIEKTSESGLSVYYELYTYDTGHYQQPYGGHLIFKLAEKSSPVFEAQVRSKRIHITLQPPYTRHQDELVIMLTEIFQGT